MRDEFIPQHFSGELEGEMNMFAGRQPSHGSAIFRRGLRQENHLIVGQSLNPLAKFPLHTNGATGVPALEGIGGQDAVFHERPIAQL